MAQEALKDLADEQTKPVDDKGDGKKAKAQDEQPQVKEGSEANHKTESATGELGDAEMITGNTPPAGAGSPEMVTATFTADSAPQPETAALAVAAFASASTNLGLDIYV
ncbi:MAG: hypothetical protein R2873_10390 [Caldilineaceae bacterium]